MEKRDDSNKEALEAERYEALKQLDEWLELPVLILGFVWMALLVIEFIWGINRLLEIIVYLIWGVFVLDFAVRFVLAPREQAHQFTWERVTRQMVDIYTEGAS